jgi:hypothetical protein
MTIFRNAAFGLMSDRKRYNTDLDPPCISDNIDTGAFRTTSDLSTRRLSEQMRLDSSSPRKQVQQVILPG